MKKFTFITLLTLCSILVNAQDIIYKKDGTELKVKIIELTTETAKYKNFEQIQGPIRNMLLSDIFMIIYEDGTKEIIKKSSDNNTTKNQGETQEVSNNKLNTQYLEKPSSLQLNNQYNNLSLNNQDLCFKARQDAANYYRGYSSASTLTGVTTVLCGGLIGLIPAIACSSTEPSSNTLSIPDYSLAQNPNYYSCYKQEAKKIKSKKVWTMFGIGVGINVTVALILLSE